MISGSDRFWIHNPFWNKNIISYVTGQLLHAGGFPQGPLHHRGGAVRYKTLSMPSFIHVFYHTDKPYFLTENP
jgi:hypothetical protein